jgi:hypothetical protein
MQDLIATLEAEIRNSLVQLVVPGGRRNKFRQFFNDRSFVSGLRRWENATEFTALVQVLYTHAFVTNAHDYVEENLLCKAKAFHHQKGIIRGSNTPAHYSQRGIMAPSHGASVSLVAAQAAGLLMSRFGNKNPFGWTLDVDLLYPNLGINHQKNDAQSNRTGPFKDFVSDYVNARNLPAIASSMWGAANIQKLSFFGEEAQDGSSARRACGYSASFFTNILDAAVRKCAGGCWTSEMTDADIVHKFGENIVEIEDITPEKLHVWGHLLHQISCGFAENMKNKHWQSDLSEEDWAMLSINYLIVLWIGFLSTNLARIGHGHDQGTADRLWTNESAACGIIFRHKLTVPKGPASGHEIVALDKKNYARDISKLIGRRFYDWNAVKTGDPMPVLFAVGAPTETFGRKYANVPVLSFYDIVANLMQLDPKTSWNGLPVAEIAAPTRLNSEGSGYEFDSSADEISSISSTSLSDVEGDVKRSVEESDSKQSDSKDVYMLDEHGNVLKLVPELQNRNIKVFSHKKERVPKKESGGGDKGVDGISLISLSTAKCVTRADLKDHFCAIVWQCTTTEHAAKLYDDLEKFEARLFGHYHKIDNHPFCDHLPDNFHNCLICKILLVTTVPDDATKNAMMAGEKGGYWLTKPATHLPYRLKSLSLVARAHPVLADDCEVDHMFFTAEQSACSADKLKLVDKDAALVNWQQEMSSVLNVSGPEEVEGIKTIADFSRKTRNLRKAREFRQMIGFIFEGYILGILSGCVPEFVVDKALGSGEQPPPTKKIRAF